MIFYLVCDGCGWESEPKTPGKCAQEICPSCRVKLGTRTVTDDEIAEKERKLAENGFSLRPCPDKLYGGEEGFSLVSESSGRKIIFGSPLEWAIEMAYNDVFVHDAYDLGPAGLRPRKDNEGK